MSKEIVINVCMGTGGIAAGGRDVMDAFIEAFRERGVDGRVEKHCAVHQVGCRGFCARDVLVDVSLDGERTTYQYIQAAMVPRLVEEHVLGGQPVTEWTVGPEYHAFHDRQVKVVLADCGNIDPDRIEEYEGVGGYTALRRILSEMSPGEVIDVVRESGLR
ncbi:MAG: NADH-quinone oxidoreductase subunit F, partial [Thermodesulfobacteriota bacterium]